MRPQDITPLASPAPGKTLRGGRAEADRDADDVHGPLARRDLVMTNGTTCAVPCATDCILPTSSKEATTSFLCTDRYAKASISANDKNSLMTSDNVTREN